MILLLLMLQGSSALRSRGKVTLRLYQTQFLDNTAKVSIRMRCMCAHVHVCACVLVDIRARACACAFVCRYAALHACIHSSMLRMLMYSWLLACMYHVSAQGEQGGGGTA